MDAEISNIDEEGDLSDLEARHQGGRNLQIITDLKHLALQIVMSIEFLPEAIDVSAATEAIELIFDWIDCLCRNSTKRQTLL